jgi:site-specific DNA-methyltransferase (adenine-specific)/modification methylase
MREPDYQTPDSSIRLYCGDYMPLLAEMEQGSVDAVVTDPPYGIGFSGCPASTMSWRPIIGDDAEKDLGSILKMPCTVIAFGANNYPRQLPHRGRWICWDKRTADGACDAMIGSPFELAWTNQTTGFDKIYRVLHGGALIDGRPGRRVHPTQKPVGLMTAIIKDYTQRGETIFDPFMGSGTTGIACVRTGRKFIGIEIEPEYFEIAVKRIEAELNREPLFREVHVEMELALA